MFKYGLFSFFAFMISFSAVISFADEMGGGASDGDPQIGDEGGSDDNNTSDGNDAGSDVGDDEQSSSPLSDDEAQQARELIAQNQEREMLQNVETSIQSRVPGFKIESVIAGLKELHKTDPGRAEFYNASEAGLEMYHRDHLANVATSDAHNEGSHAGSQGDFDSVLDKARGGDKKSVKNALSQSRA